MPEPMSGCWLWTACVDADGYGQIALGTRGKKRERAHRVAWELYRGPIPDGLQVNHSCDNPYCVNPDHLHLGTNISNNAEKVARDRSTFGEKHGASKLIEADVLAIVHDHRSQTVIAREYRVSQAQISNIKRGAQWKRTLTKVKEKYCGRHY